MLLQELQQAFQSFASYGKGSGTSETMMEGKNFAKLCKDSGALRSSPGDGRLRSCCSRLQCAQGWWAST